METVTKFAIVAGVAIVFIGVIAGVLYAIPSIPATVGNTGNPSLDWTLGHDIIQWSCMIFGKYCMFPLEILKGSLLALFAALGIRVGTKVYQMI